MTATKSLKTKPLEATIYTDVSIDGWEQFSANLKLDGSGPNKNSNYILIF